MELYEISEQAKQNVIKVVENVLICEDEKFQKAIAPCIVEALEEEPSVYDLESYGYCGNKEPLEKLKIYWEDMTEDHWEHKNKKETLSLKEAHDIDCQKIKEHLKNINITKWYYDTHTHSWFWTAENYNITLYLTKYVDTILSPKKLESAVSNLLFTMNLEEIITEIPTQILLSAIISKEIYYDHDHWCGGRYVYVTIDNNRVEITDKQWEAMAKEISHRIKNNIK